ncbi:hypothetical protein DL771_008678 [Monosporascus sp. 5C6A]|nr:hypothetical protein DL771_008678 [Monosporascus sp. 5C6A]
MLKRRTNLCAILDKLRPMKGPWAGQKMSYYPHYFALRCDEALSCFLDNMYDKWTAIVTVDSSDHGDSLHQMAQDSLDWIDAETATCLAGRAPSASISDRRLIENAFEKGEVFGQVVDSRARAILQDNVLRIRGTIPSFRTFHEHMKCFSIATRIIRHLVFPPYTINWEQPTVSLNYHVANMGLELQSACSPSPHYVEAAREAAEDVTMQTISVSSPNHHENDEILASQRTGNRAWELELGAQGAPSSVANSMVPSPSTRTRGCTVPWRTPSPPTPSEIRSVSLVPTVRSSTHPIGKRRTLMFRARLNAGA